MKAWIASGVFAGMMILSGCSGGEDINELYSGTLPRMEVAGEAGKILVEPRSMFLTYKGNALEADGEVWPLKRVEEDDDRTIYTCSIPLGEHISVSGITVEQKEGKMTLELEGGQSLELERFDLMIARKNAEYARVDLSADLSHLSENQREMLKLLFSVADIMEDIYWKQVFADRDAAMANMVNRDVEEFFRINYGPWERLNGNLPWLPGYGDKPAGSGYYPSDMSKEEFEALEAENKSSLYTLVRRKQQGGLEVVPYHEAYKQEINEAVDLLKQAAALAEDHGFRKYLELRAEALLTDDYLESDLAWMDMKDNDIDFVVGPIENYEDALYNSKAAHESFILIKDKQWSKKLAFIASVLPKMQKGLPVPGEYKREVPGSDSDLGAYDVIYYAGDCNAGSKTIAINLPNDERVHAEKGSRKLQLKNSIRYKFEEILLPISNVLIDEGQRDHVTFDAFFENIMFHEVAHGLGINQTINEKGSVREALKEQYSALEEGKADILSLFLITKMTDEGLLEKEDLMDNYVTFMASIFRSIRFGVASSHGKANMIRFYYFQESGAFSRDITKGTYRVDMEKMQAAMNNLATLILTTQGDGDYQEAKRMVDQMGFIREELKEDLKRLQELSIPVDIVFNQGPEVSGL